MAKYTERIGPFRVTEELMEGLKKFADLDDRKVASIARIWLLEMYQIKLKQLKKEKPNVYKEFFEKN